MIEDLKKDFAINVISYSRIEQGIVIFVRYVYVNLIIIVIG